MIAAGAVHGLKRKDMAVAVSPSFEAKPWTASQNYPTKSNSWAELRVVAPALLMLVVSGCFNPPCIGQVRPRENHVPVVQVQPDPSFEPIRADVGDECAATALSIIDWSDADGDTLTVRFDMLLQRRVGSGPSRIELREFQPIPALPDGSYPLGTTPLVIDSNLVDSKLGGVPDDLDLADTQLIELRVSDSGFVNDENGDPVVGEGGGLFFSNWLIRLADVPCSAVP